MVAAHNMDTATCATLEAKPGPAAQTRGVNTRSSNICRDWPRAKEEHATKLLLVEVVMDITISNSTYRELGSKPFPEGGRLWHFGPVEIGLTSSKNVQIQLGDEGPKFQNFGVLCRRHWEASNVAEAQLNVTRGFWSGERITKCGVHQKKSQGGTV